MAHLSASNNKHLHFWIVQLIDEPRELSEGMKIERWMKTVDGTGVMFGRTVNRDEHGGEMPHFIG